MRGFTEGRGEGGEAAAFLGLFLVALCLLVIACANVSNLLLTRALDRLRPLAVQAALGAGRRQVALQLLLEAGVLAVLGGAVGVGLARAFTGWIQGALATEHFGYFWMRMGVDAPVLALVAALTVGTTLAAGTLPALRAARTDVQRALKEGAAGVPGTPGPGGAFVTVQLALSCAALVGAGLAVRTLAGTAEWARGVPADEVVVASVDLGGSGRDGAARRRYWEALAGELGALHGGPRVSVAVAPPGFMEPFGVVEVAGAEAEGERPPTTGWVAVTPSFFDQMDVAAVRGRLLREADGGAEAPPVAVVSRSFASRHLGGRDPLGTRIRLPAVAGDTALAVVGVVEDVELGAGPGVREDRVYVAVGRFPPERAYVLVRERGGAGRAGDEPAIARAILRAVAAVDPDVPVEGPWRLEERHAWLLRLPRVMGWMAAGGGAAGLVVAAAGLYGLLGFRVRRMRRELGVRMALGAGRGRVVAGVLAWAVARLLPAAVLGLGAAWAAAPFLGAALLVDEVRPVATLAPVGAAFVLTGLVAALVPALRAGAVEPATVLRGDG